MKKSSFQTSIWERIKLIAAAVCFVLMILQIYSGIKMLNTNTELPPEVKYDHFDSVSTGSEISGKLTHCEGWFNMAIEDIMADSLNSGSGLMCYLVLTDTDHIIVFRAPGGSKFSKAMQSLIKGETESVDYRGKVKGLPTDIILALKNYISTRHVMEKNNLKGKSSDAILGTMVDASDIGAGFSDKEIFVTFIGVILLLIVFLLLINKTVYNTIYTVKVNKGEIYESRVLDRKDYIFENEGFYDGSTQNNDFFVNTEHNVRNEGSTDDEAPEDLMTHMVSQGEFFYEGGTNEEGNFYVDSEKKTVTPYSKPGDTDNLLKKY